MEGGKFPLAAAQSKDRDAAIQQILTILHKWGIHTIGQLAALPKEELRARLGGEAVRLWERAQGKATRLLQWIQPPPSFIERFEFENEIETAEPLLFVLRRFLQQLALRLNGIYLVTNELTLQIDFANKESYRRCFQIPQPTNEIDLLFRILQTHLEDFKSEHPVIAVSLEAHPAEPAPHQFGLFETALRNPNRLSETLARLSSLLGEERVGTPVLEETHRPDAFRMEPFVWEAEATDLQSRRPDSSAGITSFSSLDRGGGVGRTRSTDSFRQSVLNRFGVRSTRPLSAFGQLVE